jgi:hypothetical protein
MPQAAVRVSGSSLTFVVWTVTETESGFWLRGLAAKFLASLSAELIG